MKVKGFTLVELLITMSVFIGLTFSGFVTYSYIIRKNEQQTICDELKAAIQYAKIQAVSRGEFLTLSPLRDSLNWANGLQLTARNKRTHLKETLYQWRARHPRWSLTWSGARSVNQVVFSHNPAHAISNGRFTLVNLDTHEQYVIILNRLGRVKMKLT